jgi:transposase
MTEPVFVGLDIHRHWVHVAVLGGAGKQPRHDRIPNTREALGAWAASTLRRTRRGVSCACEAGPSSIALARILNGYARMRCIVVAPTRVARQRRGRVKTDARDAERLAELLRADALVRVSCPGEEEEALRRLSRARESSGGTPCALANASATSRTAGIRTDRQAGQAPRAGPAKTRTRLR